MHGRRLSKLLAATLLALSALLPFGPDAGATVMMDLDLEEMVDRADAIVHGRVLRAGSRLEAEGRRLAPFTIVELQVFDWLKGEGEARIRLREAGGAHPNGRSEVVGAPRYRPGEEVVLFLLREPPYYRTLALSLGKLVVQRPRGEATPTVEREHHPGLVRLRDPRKDSFDDAAPLGLQELRARVARRLQEHQGSGEGAE